MLQLKIPHVDLLAANVPGIIGALKEALTQQTGCTDTPAAAAAITAATATAAAAASRWALPLLEAFTAARVSHKETTDLLLQLLLRPQALQQLQLPELASLAVCVASGPLLGGPHRGPQGPPRFRLLSPIAARASEILDLLPNLLSSSSSNNNNSSSNSKSSSSSVSTPLGALPNYGSPLGPLPGRSAAFLISAFCSSSGSQWEEEEEEQQQQQEICVVFRDRLLLELLPVSLPNLTAWELAVAAQALSRLYKQLNDTNSSSSSSSNGSSISAAAVAAAAGQSVQGQQQEQQQQALAQGGQHRLPQPQQQQQQQQQEQQQQQGVVRSVDAETVGYLMTTLAVAAGRRLHQLNAKVCL